MTRPPKRPDAWFTVGELARVFDCSEQSVRQTFLPLVPGDCRRQNGRRIEVFMRGFWDARCAVVAAARHGADDPDEFAMATAPKNCPHAARWRRLRADKLQVEIWQLVKELVHRVDVQNLVNSITAIVQRAGERLAREFGTAAAALLGQTIDDMARVVTPWESSVHAERFCPECGRLYTADCAKCLLIRSLPDANEIQAERSPPKTDDTDSLGVDRLAGGNPASPSVVPSAAGPQAAEAPAGEGR